MLKNTAPPARLRASIAAVISPPQPAALPLLAVGCWRVPGGGGEGSEGWDVEGAGSLMLPQIDFGAACQVEDMASVGSGHHCPGWNSCAEAGPNYSPLC